MARVYVPGQCNALLPCARLCTGNDPKPCNSISRPPPPLSESSKWWSSRQWLLPFPKAEPPDKVRERVPRGVPKEKSVCQTKQTNCLALPLAKSVSLVGRVQGCNWVRTWCAPCTPSVSSANINVGKCGHGHHHSQSQRGPSCYFFFTWGSAVAVKHRLVHRSVRLRA